MFFKLLKDALKIKQVRSKILFTLFIILVFRIGTTITVPGINAKALNSLSDLPFLNMLSLVSGNAMRNFSVFALGVSPYITASIVVQLLQMDLLPKFVEWGKQGEVGRRKLNQATRYISLVLAFVQSIGITAGFATLSRTKLVANPNWQTYLLIGALLTTGSVIVTWLGEQITDKGYGNGVSMIIFAGIVSGIPGMIKGIYEDYFVNIPSDRLNSSLIFVGILIVAVLVIIYFTTFVQQAEYKIPIQYTKIAQGAPSSSYLPLKVNPAGVIPVIFASSITAAPAAIFQFVSAMGYNASWVRTAQALLATTTISGMFTYALLIILFTFFYTFVQINPEKTAENLQKSGAYIPGVRPGKGTEEYMSKLLRRLATVGSLFLGIITIIPILAKDLFGLTDAVALGGTSLLIIISTGIEGMKQLEGYLLKRKYVGFMDTTTE
ncbi:preprotein translocase subunit SecY [Streptococcus cristatus]|jgi:preprotein translocase, secY subunit|uniref:Protein translocase subunit SecY n=3 Tax=Streptococcus cristatus TaxID=45634 RepID=A0A3R9I012_STRCR|nr:MULTISPECIES: preprotein translocase subunit SecY [Streptococcus]RKV95597.1 MAG: preprotein translocase subunit SecY [Streptococcus sp.]EFX52487.1 preprotein translocase, SecY subunit [Streptococcus cristatus ATCC 51100]EGU69019.1 preprotein translocase, SecY subunit [Streptococcus cristatus ATCC 51100]KJQ61643.1 preprotein translocase subunit SecY [Streptococcus cristatus]MBC6978113.1 preprotein translocase subunit SecY [Streptococcus cristatus]